MEDYVEQYDFHYRMREEFVSGQHLLQLAVCDSDLATLEALLRTLPDINDSSRVGTPLMVAVYWENLEAARMLLDAGADPFHRHHTCVGFDTPIGLAASRGRFEICRLMWTTLPDELAKYEKDCPGDSCLVSAAFYGRTWLLEYLLDGWLDSSVWSVTNLDAALLSAAGAWQVHTATLLLDRVKTYTTDTLRKALFAAVTFKAVDHKDSRNPDYRSIDFANQELLVKRFLEAGQFNPDIYYHGRPLIYYAVEYINLAGALRALLDKGADPDSRDEDGRTPLHHISIHVRAHRQQGSSFDETRINMLLEHGASTTAADHQGETPLHAAALGCDLGLFYRFLRRAAQDALSATNSHGETLLHYAAAGGNISVMRFLLEAPTTIPDNVNRANSNGWTPILCALAPPDIEGEYSSPSEKSPADAVQAAQLLLSHGADAGAVTGEGWSALHLLAHCESHVGDTRFSALAEALIDKGAPLHAEARGLSPDWWCGEEKPGVVVDGFPWGFRMRVVTEAAREVDLSPEAMTAVGWARRFGAKAVEGVLLARGAKPAPRRLYSSFFSPPS